MPVQLPDDLLFSVQRPARYVGGEVNTVVKDHRAVRAALCLCFPDVYDLAMDYQGFQIFYPMVNEREEYLAERCHCPWPDMADGMRERGIPLHGLESKTPLREFNLLGFTLQHELNFTNIIEMLDLAGLAPLARDRDGVFPLVIAGGPGALAPEPLAEIVDAFVIGEGELILFQMLDLCAQWRESGSRDKEALLLALAQIRGVYVPRFYDEQPDGSVRPNRSDVPAIIDRVICDITQETWSVRPVVPNQRTVSERVSFEIKRGCTRGCRFCQAGMITRPLRERTPEQIMDLVDLGVKNTGYREVSLMSLSSADYSALAPLMRELNEKYADRHLSLALSSMRVNAFDVDFADQISKGKKTGFTFAPEAGTERLRSVINKELSDEQFLNVVSQVFHRGWQRLKFYFMCSLPTETDEDLMGIVHFTERAVEKGKQFWGNNFEIAVSVSPFIAKPHTPFQWEGLLTREEVDRRWRLVADNLRSRNVRIRPHSADQAWVEAAFARGGRAVGRAMLRAWKMGARFDSWDDHFHLELWQRAFDEEGIDTHDLIHAAWDHDRPLPWDHIEAGLGKKFLVREHQKAMAKRLTDDCAFSHCTGCNSCDFETIKNIVVREKPLNTYESIGEMPAPAEPGKRQPPPERNEPEPVVKLRLRLTKRGVARYLSHLDFAQLVLLNIGRAGLPVSFSQGFSPKPRVMFSPSLPLGYTAAEECCDIVLRERGDAEAWVAALNRTGIPDVSWSPGCELGPHEGNIQADVTHADYRVRIADPERTLGLPLEALRARLAEFLASKSLVVEETARPKKRKPGKRGRRGPRVSKKDFRAMTDSLTLSESEGAVTLDLRLDCGSYGSLDPLKLLSKLLERDIELGSNLSIERTALWCEKGGDLVSPFEAVSRVRAG